MDLNKKLSEINIDDFILFSKTYTKHLIDLLKKLDHKNISKTIEILEKSRKEGRRIFLIGNGGSASTASHIANDFGLVISKSDKFKFHDPYRVNSLVDNNSLLTAIGNDFGYDDIFLEQLKINFKKNDLIIAISASGNSPNLIKCVKWAKKNGGNILSWVGFDGGELKKLSDLCIHVKTIKGEYAPVEDIHLIINHIIVTWMQHNAKRL